MTDLLAPVGQGGHDGASGSRTEIDGVVTHHVDGFRSGVARFNELLAEHLGVPLAHFEDGATARMRRPLISFKVSELPPEAAHAVTRLLSRAEAWDVFLHEFCGCPLEESIVSGAGIVYCGNRQIEDEVVRLNARVARAWTPGLLTDDRHFEPAEITVFSFGMAHKIRTDMFRRLRELLEASGRSYAVYVSTANHETTSMKDAAAVYAEMHDIFPSRLYFLGNLSDVAVANYVATTTFFAAFFEGGVRANNTSVASALERGAVVITNLDGHSPSELEHMDNVIDLGRCEALPIDTLALKRLSVRAMETGRERGWDALVRMIRSNPAARTTSTSVREEGEFTG